MESRLGLNETKWLNQREGAEQRNQNQNNNSMEKRRRRTSPTSPSSTSSAVLLLVGTIFFTILGSVSCIDDKCGACNAVAEEIEIGLSNEKPRNHLDMRHRLDSTGQRRGKVIDYRVSELRVVELLDGLCDKMQDYTLKKVDSARHEWAKVHNWDKLTTDKQAARAYSKDISSYCGRLLEETEDELTELIKEGSVKTGEVSKVLCQDLSRHCNKISAADPEDDDDEEDYDESDREL